MAYGPTGELLPEAVKEQITASVAKASVVSPGNALALLPARARQIVYVVFGLVALADSSALVGYGSVAHSLPSWLVIATAVITFLAVPVQSLAAVNVTRTTGESF